MTFLSDVWRENVRTRAVHLHLADARHALDQQVSQYREFLPETPNQQAGYYHNYFCPQHAVQLVFDPHNSRHHVCPVDGATFSGEPFDSARLWLVNDILSDAAFKSALRAYLDPLQSSRTEDQTRARDILTAYAERYITLPRAPGEQPRYPGQMMWSSLDESVWIIRLAWAFALIDNSLFYAERTRICSRLLRPVVDHLLRTRRTDIHNITNWNNAALATLALALDDDTLLAVALDGPSGLHAQLSQGVRADGFWWEGSLSYHYYTLAALVWTLRALYASGRAFDDRGVLRKMFDAPIAIAFPDLSLPAIHDCWYPIGLTGAVGHGIPDAAGFYEFAYGWFGDPVYEWILHTNYARRPRSSFEALLDGAIDIADAPEPPFGNHRAPESGLAVLRTHGRRDAQTCLLLKAGPDGKRHGHPDQLSIELFANGRLLSADLGTSGYGIGLNDTWYRQTASHSTVLIDGHSQPPTSGRIVDFRAQSDPVIVQAEASWDGGEFAGVRMRRCIFWRGAYFVDLFTVDCAAERKIDWIYHNSGDLISPRIDQSIEDALVGDCGYEHVTQVGVIGIRENPVLCWQTDRAKLALHFAPQKTSALFSGKAPGNPAPDQISLVVHRQTGARAIFLAVFCPYSDSQEPFVRSVEWRRTDDLPYEFLVQTLDGPETWSIDSPDRSVVGAFEKTPSFKVQIASR